MDHLGIEKFPLMVASGGGCVGFRMAIQHPDKVQCLITQCATTGDYIHPEMETISAWYTKFGMTSPSVARMVGYFMDSDMASAMKEEIMQNNKIKPNCVTDAEAQKQAEAFVKDPFNKPLLDNMKGFMACGAAYPDHFDGGMANDLEYYKVKIPFDQVKVPVHMIHGDADADILYSQAVQAHKGIADSILITQENCGHSCNIHPKFKENWAQQIAFARKHCGMAYDEEILKKEL